MLFYFVLFGTLPKAVHHFYELCYQCRCASVCLAKMNTPVSVCVYNYYLHGYSIILDYFIMSSSVLMTEQFTCEIQSLISFFKFFIVWTFILIILKFCM